MQEWLIVFVVLAVIIGVIYLIVRRGSR